MDFFPSLLAGYLALLRSPPVLLAILLVTGPILLELFKNKILSKGTAKPKVAGCFRLGVTKRSNLDDQYEHKDNNSDPSSGIPTPRIKALFTYPVKSCRGVELAASEVGATGLKYDRLFSFAQLISEDKSKTTSDNEVADVSSEWKHQWRFITQREFPRLALLKTELWVPDPKTKCGVQPNGSLAKNVNARAQNQKDQKASLESFQSVEPINAERDNWATHGGCLIVRFPFEPDFNPFGLRTEVVTIEIPIAPMSERAKVKEYSHEPLSIWKDCATSINVSNEIAPHVLAKLKYFLGVSNPLALFRVDEKNQRAVTRSLPNNRPGESYSVGFADAFPLHILSIASVRAVDDELPHNAVAMRRKLDARRFRANIYVTATAAYEEDNWKKITTGRGIRPEGGRMVETDGEYHVACRTARCKLPNVNPDTGIKDVNEPYTTLGCTRKVDKGAWPHPCLGMQMIPLLQQGILKVGDEIYVIQRGEHCYEKMFS